MNIRHEKKEFGLFILTMVIVGLLSLISLRWLSEGWVIRRIIAGGVGDALLVAALLAVTVDRYIKSDLIREASRDVHKYLVGYHLPEELKERIQEMMCESIIRRDWHIEYTLSPEQNGEVTIDVKYRFQLENVTNRTVEYLPMIQAEKYLNPTIVELRCDDAISHFRLIAKDGESLGTESRTVRGLIELRHNEIGIKPRSSGQTSYPFSGHYRLRTPCNHGDTFSFGRPSLGVTITTNAPSGYMFSIEPSPWTIQTDNMYQIKGRAFLRSEHVMVRWMKMDGLDSAQKADATVASALKDGGKHEH